jgi:hypothetical protein
MPRTTAATVLAAGSLALVAGCGGGAEQADDAPIPASDAPRAGAVRQLLADSLESGRAPRPGPTPAGFRRRDAMPGFSVALPRRWQALRRGDAVFPGVAQTLARSHRHLTGYLAGLALPDSPLKLLAFDPGRRSGGMAVTVLAVPRGAGSGSWQDTVVRQVRGLRSFRPPLRVRRVALPAGRALRLDYTRAYAERGRGSRVATVQYVVAGADSLVTLTLASSPATSGRYARSMAAAAKSISLG